MFAKRGNSPIRKNKININTPKLSSDDYINKSKSCSPKRGNSPIRKKYSINTSKLSSGDYINELKLLKEL